jgi:hypothetical protein
LPLEENMLKLQTDVAVNDIGTQGKFMECSTT